MNDIGIDSCVECRTGTYADIVEDYHIGGETIKDLDLHRCSKCSHTTLPWTSVERVDKVLEQLRNTIKLENNKGDTK